MPINEGLANLSHYSFVATVVAYALAVLAFACDFAFGRDALGPLRPARKPAADLVAVGAAPSSPGSGTSEPRSEEHTSELQSHVNLVCRLLLDNKKKTKTHNKQKKKKKKKTKR